MDIIREKKKIFYTYLIYFSCMLLFCIVKILHSFGVFSKMDPQVYSVLYSLFLQLILMLVLPLILYHLLVRKDKPREKGYTRRELGLNKVSYKIVLISIAIGFIIYFINIAISTLFSGLLGFMGYKNPFVSSGSGDYSIGTFFIQLFITAVLPGVCEEFLHRGMLIHGTKKGGYKKAILISSLLFGLIHFNINQFFFAVLLGVLLGFIVVVCKSILPAMIIHFMNNGIILYLTFARYNNWPLHNFETVINSFLNGNSWFMIFVVCFLIIAFLIFMLVLLVMQMFKITTLNKVQKTLSEAFEGDYEKDLLFKSQKSRAWREVLEHSGSLNLQYEEMKSPVDFMLPPQKSIVKTNTRVNLFLYSSIILGFLITLFTFIWGMV